MKSKSSLAIILATAAIASGSVLLSTHSAAAFSSCAARKVQNTNAVDSPSNRLSGFWNRNLDINHLSAIAVGVAAVSGVLAVDLLAKSRSSASTPIDLSEFSGTTQEVEPIMTEMDSTASEKEVVLTK